MGITENIVKHLTFPMINRYYDRNKGTYKYLKEFEKTQYYSYDRLIDLQKRSLTELLRHAYKNTRYYRELFDQHGVKIEDGAIFENFRKVPILTKIDIRENLQDLIARNYGEKELHSSETGGTTGVKIKFYRDNYSLAPKTAATIRHERWTGWDIGERVGLVWPARQDYVGEHGWKAKLKNQLTNRYVTLPAAILFDEDIYKYCMQLKKYQPTKIRCFPYSLYLVAKFILDHRIDGIRPKGIIATGEPLYEHQRVTIEEAFQCKVFNSYGSRETGLISQECEFHDGLHVNMESLFVEITGKDGVPLEEGEIGEIVVTDFFNYGMPLIRYSMGDLGILSRADCPCGRNLHSLKEIAGRTVDVVKLADGRIISSITLVLYLVDNGPKVGQVQIIQKSMDHFVIKFTKDPEPDESVFHYYERKGKEILGDQVNISFEVVDSIPREASGKYVFIKSCLADN